VETTAVAVAAGIAVGVFSATAVAVGVLIAGSVTVGGTAVAIGSVVVVVESSVGGTAVCGSAVQAFKTKRKTKKIKSNREFTVRSPKSI
jgi:hypothetical protein